MAVPRGAQQLPAPCAALIVLDGWGIAPDGPGERGVPGEASGVRRLWDAYPHTQLTACGRAVGLPEGQMGNSEVGEALIRLEAELGVSELVPHAFTDGRDTSPTAGAGYLETIEQWMAEAGAGRIGSVVGRYYAMDRDKRWDRIQLAYDLLVHGRAEHTASRRPEAARAAYERDETDEFIKPVLVGEEARIRSGDSVFAINFRPDRMCEVTRALAEPEFSEVDRGGASPVEHYACMTAAPTRRIL